MGLKKWFNKDAIEAGCDEAGRGCLAGPVVAAAVVLNPKKRPPIPFNDSKKLSLKSRLILKEWILKNALSSAVGVVSHEEIDEINILNASFLAMHRAIEQLNIDLDLILVDGNRFKPYSTIAHECIIKGDSKYQSIAAASILAKTYRDDIMAKFHSEYPQFDWKNNKGYPTKTHRDAIIRLGASPYHRKSFQLIPKQLSLNI